MPNLALFTSITDSLGQVEKTLNTGSTTVPGPVNQVSSLSNYDMAYSYDISLPAASQVPTTPAFYQGSLSSHGSLVAMQINKGTYNYARLPSDNPANLDADGNPKIVLKPYLTGYLREYWRDPLQITLGASSAIPALTGVMPSSLSTYSQTPGSALYYMDLQMTRLSGSNFFDSAKFCRLFERKFGYLVSVNKLSPDVITTQDIPNEIGYFGRSSYEELITGGLSNLAKGEALRIALFNIGTIIQQVSSNYFGTPNAVAKQMLDSNLGSVGNLQSKLVQANVNLNDIYLSRYSEPIAQVLKTITNTTDLVTIQNVLKSSVPNFMSPLDYTSIEKCAGRPNDSMFSDFVAVGKELYNNFPQFNLETGKDLVTQMDFIAFNDSLNYISDQGILVPDTVVDNQKNEMIFAPDGSLGTLYNVIGCGTGYLTSQLTQVNEFIEKLNQSKFGNNLHQALNDISTSYSRYRQDYYNNGNSANSLRALLQSITDYEQLLNTVAADAETSDLVKTLNMAWVNLCEHLSYEVINYNKDTDPTQSAYSLDQEISSFPFRIQINYYKDEYGIKPNSFLKDMAQDNLGGKAAVTLIDYYSNLDVIANMGGKVRI